MRRGSFAAAARVRNVSPSAVSRTVASLEESLGIRLFQRTTRKLRPTAAGITYFERVEPLIAELEDASLVARDSGNSVRGRLRITAPISFSQVNMVPLFVEFASKNPDVEFELLLDDRQLDLVGDRVDVAIRLGRLMDSSLVSCRLCDMIYVACASPSYLEKAGVPECPSDLTRFDCLRYPVPRYGPRWRFRDQNGVIEEVFVDGRVTATNGLALKQCAVEGMGIVMLPRWNLSAELQANKLVPLLTDYVATASEFDVAAWLLYPTRKYLPAKVRAFVDFVREAFRDGPPAERGLQLPLRGPKPARSQDTDLASVEAAALEPMGASNGQAADDGAGESDPIEDPDAAEEATARSAPVDSV